jgi:hypothetical protein
MEPVQPALPLTLCALKSAWGPVTGSLKKTARGLLFIYDEFQGHFIVWHDLPFSDMGVYSSR